MLDQIYSCLATNWQAPGLAMGLACSTVDYSLVLVSGCFLLLLFPALLIILFCSAWEHTDNNNGLADGQGIAAVPVLLYWTGWNSRPGDSDCG